MAFGIKSINYENGDRYEGSVVSGKPHGKGKMFYANGSSYDGEWDNGNYEGYGIQTLKNGRIGKGMWHNGKPVIKDAKFLIKYPNDNNWYDQFGHKIEQGIEVREFVGTSRTETKNDKEIEVEGIKGEVENPEIEELFDENGIPIGGKNAGDFF